MLLHFKTAKLGIKPETPVKNDTVIKMECSCIYLGHMTADVVDDNEYIKRYICCVWCKYTVCQNKEVCVA